MLDAHSKVEWISAGEQHFRALEQQNNLEEKSVMQLIDMDSWEFEVLIVLLFFSILSQIFIFHREQAIGALLLSLESTTNSRGGFHHVQNVTKLLLHVAASTSAPEGVHPQQLNQIKHPNFVLLQYFISKVDPFLLSQK